VVDNKGIFTVELSAHFITPTKNQTTTQSRTAVRSYFESLPEFQKLRGSMEKILGSSASFRVQNIGGEIVIAASPVKTDAPIVTVTANKSITIETLIPQAVQETLKFFTVAEDQAQLAALVRSSLAVHKIETAAGVYYQFGTGPEGWRLEIQTNGIKTEGRLVKIDNFANTSQMIAFVNSAASGLSPELKKKMIEKIKAALPGAPYAVRITTQGNLLLWVGSTSIYYDAKNKIITVL
jgi:hypothetical protein